MNAAAGLLYQTGLKLLEYQSSKKTPALRVAIFNAFPHPLLSELVCLPEELQIQQHIRPLSLKLSQQGIPSSPEISECSFDMILILGSKQRIQTLGWIATAMDLLSFGGQMLFCTSNDLSARAFEKRIIELAGNARVAIKSKCRCVCVQKSDEMNTTLMREWKEQALPHAIFAHDLISQPGIFSWDRIDTGSCLLAKHLPDDLSGCGMDLGCGNGFLSASILRQCDKISGIHLVDSDATAIACATQNLPPVSHTKIYMHWLDATAEPIPQSMDWVVLNPPFHAGKSQDITLGKAMVHAACCCLKPSGTLFMVANRKLPYESILDTYLKNTKYLYEGEGFKVIEGIK
ncbi:MAG: methyltransferase [Mariprofundaceae bacterium]|nr:methyltransferase [Mariprofundaceae bacterium]